MRSTKKDADRPVLHANRSGVSHGERERIAPDAIDNRTGSEREKFFASDQRYPREGLLTRQRTAKLLAISLRKLDLLIAAKEIAVARFGRSVRIDPRELDRFVERCSRRGEGVRQ